MWYKNKLTKLIGTDYPIIQAPMAGGVTTSEFVSSVSNAGVLGMIGAGYMNPEELRKQIREIKQLTTRPFGVNLFIPQQPSYSAEDIKKANELLQSFRDELGIESETQLPPYENVTTFEENLNVVIEEKVPVCSFTFGVPSKDLIIELKKHNIVVIGTATTVNEALIDEEVGMDAVVVQGSEAGGHRGTFVKNPQESLVGLMALLPQVVDQVNIPVIASGGVMDGRGVIASMFLGAEGVQLGTAFLTTIESGAHEQHKKAILRANEDETMLTTVFSGKPARGINNQFMIELKRYEDSILDYPIQHYLTSNIRKEAANQDNPEFMSLWSGQGVRLSKNQSVTELISGIVTQVNQLLKNSIN
jgi:nitronate monooxygenase